MVFDEPAGPSVLDASKGWSRTRMSAPNFVEAAIVIDSREPRRSADFDGLLAALDLPVEPVTVEQARLARAGYHTFGKGSGHPAHLNFGDDFSHTDVTIALDPGGDAPPPD